MFSYSEGSISSSGNLHWRSTSQERSSVFSYRNRDGDDQRSDDERPKKRICSSPESSGSNLSDNIEDLKVDQMSMILSRYIDPQVSKTHFLGEKLLPVFNPEVQEFSSKEWLELVNSYGDSFGWDDRTRLYLAILKLEGRARKWYDGWLDCAISWEIFSRALSRQFPGQQSFGAMLEKASSYKSVPGQDLTLFCYEKLARINKLKLDLPDHKVIDIIIHGIHDENICATIKQHDCKTIPEFFEKVSFFDNPSPKSDNNTEITDLISFKERNPKKNIPLLSRKNFEKERSTE